MLMIPLPHKCVRAPPPPLPHSATFFRAGAAVAMHFATPGKQTPWRRT